MQFLKDNRRFDFLYGGKPFSELEFACSQVEKEHNITTVYTFADGLKITNIASKHGDAYEWVNWLENTSDKPTEIISELWDGCVTLPLPHEEPLGFTSYQPEFDEVTAVYAPSGSTWVHNEFCAQPDVKANNRYTGQLPVGETMEYSASGGRSSEKNAPFFNIHKSGRGYICAIGWTGQWNCSISRTEDAVTIKTKIEDTHFRLLPGEKIRTSSVVLMPYEGSVIESQNKWRRLVKEHYSLIGAQGRAQHGPLCAAVWGGMRTSSVLERIETIRENGLPFEYIWMDAGWYGADTKPTPDEFEGDWGEHTGDWRVSPLIHGNGLKDVSEAIHKAGMKFVLWFEPERVWRSVPIVAEHPEYFIIPECEEEFNILLDLGNEEAWNYCFDTLSQLIEEIGVDCYRQDFNMFPLGYWRLKDAEDRKGITEIKHINGLYRLWDAMLQKFPNLLIDNCASGGRRIDIETLRRSVPLWRSDYQCPANYVTAGAQCHNLNFNTWMPFSGTGGGRLYDTYRIRSAYSPALTTSYTSSERETFGDDPEKMAWIKKQLAEYLKVRPYMSEDFYPLTQVSDRSDIWCAAQFDRPSEHDGIVQIFRRENSPYETASFALFGIDQTANYIFTDADDGKEMAISGAELAEKGFCIGLKEKRTSKIYFYKKV